MKNLKKDHEQHPVNVSINQPLISTDDRHKLASQRFKLKTKPLGDFFDILKIDKPEDIPYYSLILGDKYNCLPLKQVDWESEKEKIYEIFNKIPVIHKYMANLNLALDDNDPLPVKIDQELVHKRNAENVIISQPQKFGNMWYFNMFDKIKEINFDHVSDHVNGMLLIEVVRQAGIATMHLNGLPIKGKMNLSNICTQFHNYVESNSPVIIRSISSPVDFRKNTHFKAYAIVNLVQFGKVCATSKLEGTVFEHSEYLQHYRNRSININDRIKSGYQNLINQIRS